MTFDFSSQPQRRNNNYCMEDDLNTSTQLEPMTEVMSLQQEPQAPESFEQESRASYDQSSQRRGPYESLWDL